MDQWFFTKEELQSVPTIIQDGITVAEEQRMRSQGCSFIQAIGCRLSVPQITVATAIVYFHRFYMRCSFSEYGMEHVSGACVYLACKVEESSRKVSHVAMACLMSKHRKLSEDEKQKSYQSWRSAILWHERFLLEILCFDMTIDHPQQLLLEFGSELDAPEKVVQAAYGFANDSLRKPLCLIYDPQMIAAACILLGYRAVNETIPTSTDTIWGKTLDQQPDLLAEIIGDIANVYNETFVQSGSDSSSNSSPISSFTPPNSNKKNGHTKSSSTLRNGYSNSTNSS